MLMSRILNHLTKKNVVLPSFIQKIRSVHYQDAYKFTGDDWIVQLIGNREVVGFGTNGQPEYVDRVDFPFPSIRYKTPTSEVLATCQKQRGDWRLLSMDEKKEIYRANYCQTFVEMGAPTGEWMWITGWTLVFVSVGIWLFLFYKLFVYPQCPRPPSFQESWQREQLQRILNARMNPVLGLSSKWDYETGKWKKKPWYIPWDDPFAEVEEIECEEDL